MSASKKDSIAKDAGWQADIDPCCNLIGSNSEAYLFYSAFEDATKQVDGLKGKKIWCNPTWKLAAKYVKTIESAADEDSETKCVFVIADKKGTTKSNEWIKEFKQSNKWGLLRFYAKSSRVFTEPSVKSGCSIGRRSSVPSLENIIVCQLREPGSKARLTFKQQLEDVYGKAKKADHYGIKPKREGDRHKKPRLGNRHKIVSCKICGEAVQRRLTKEGAHKKCLKTKQS